jgi:hypothetical protein
MAPVPEAHVEPLIKIYQPKKVTLASLELYDTPGLDRSHEGNAARLGLIREAGCLVLVVAAFAGSDPAEDLANFEEDLILTDMEIVSNRIARLEESVKKPRPTRDAELAELEALKPLLEALESSTPLRDVALNEEQRRVVRAFQLLSQKPKMIVVNMADDDEDEARFESQSSEAQPVVAYRLGLELELSRMSPDDRAEFEAEFGLKASEHDNLLRRMMDVSGQFIYLTAGEKEVRTWMLPKGGTALEAADNIHSDLARGFIRAETMRCEDLIQLGSERDVKAQGLVRQEPKDYVVQPGDILHVKFNV